MISNVERLANATAHRIEAENTATITRKARSLAQEVRRDARALANKSENLGLPGAGEARAKVYIADTAYDTALKADRTACKELRHAISSERFNQNIISNLEKNRAIVAQYEAAVSNSLTFLGVSYSASEKIIDFDMGRFGSHVEEETVSITDVNELDILIASLSAIADKMRS